MGNGKLFGTATRHRALAARAGLLAKNDEKNALRLLDWVGKDVAAHGHKDMPLTARVGPQPAPHAQGHGARGGDSRSATATPAARFRSLAIVQAVDDR